MTILSAFQTAGGIQLNETTDQPDTISCRMVFPGDADWEVALAAAGYFNTEPEVPAPTIEDLREHAVLSKVEFLERSIRMGFLDVQSATQASRGYIPDDLLPAFDGIDPLEVAIMGVKWAASTEIDRMHPFVQATAAYLEIPDEAVDALFGIGPVAESPPTTAE